MSRCAFLNSFIASLIPRANSGSFFPPNKRKTIISERMMCHSLNVANTTGIGVMRSPAITLHPVTAGCQRSQLWIHDNKLRAPVGGVGRIVVRRFDGTILAVTDRGNPRG